MAKIYYRKITAGEMTIDNVPQRWKEEVQSLLDGGNVGQDVFGI